MPTYALHSPVSSQKGTFGILYRDSQPLCVTCEDPWNNNAKGISCIPSGGYKVRKHSGPRYQNVWEVTSVPGRTAILIHSGNTINDTQGCILVGKGFAMFGDLPAITESVATLNMLRKELPDEFTLIITRGAE